MQQMVDLPIRGCSARFKTTTVDNGNEFHGDEQIESKTKVNFYFAPLSLLGERRQ